MTKTNKTIEWKLIFNLSISALIFGFITHYLNYEIITAVIWIIIIIINSYYLARKCSTSIFFNGFLLGVFMFFWTVILRIFIFDNYIKPTYHYNQLTRTVQKYVESQTISRITINGITIGILSGLILALSTCLFYKIDALNINCI